MRGTRTFVGAASGGGASAPIGVHRSDTHTSSIEAMSKFGKFNRDQSRRAGRARVEETEASIAWQPDPTRPRHEERNTNAISATTRVSVRIVRYDDTKQIIEFAVVVDRFVNDTWSEVLCIDTCNHGTVHRHRNNDHVGEPDIIATITSQETIQNACWEAIDEAYDEAKRE